MKTALNDNELFLLDFEMHAYQGENEETEHYTQLYYSDEETFYDTGDREGDRFLQDTDAGDGVNYSTDEDRGPQVCQLCC